MITPTLSVTTKGGSPVPLETFKNAIKRSDDAYDANLSNLLETATDLIENHCNRAMKTQTLSYVVPESCMNTGSDGIELPRPPLQSPLTSLKSVNSDTGAETSISATLYYLDIASEPGRVVLKSGNSWSDLINPFFKFVYLAGYGTTDASVPEALRRGVMMLAAHLYVEGMNLTTTALPPEIEFIIRPYVITKV